MCSAGGLWVEIQSQNTSGYAAKIDHKIRVFDGTVVSCWLVVIHWEDVLAALKFENS
jgi:hypothetical protein